MTDDDLIRLREIAAEVEELRARVEQLERENEELRAQLAFYRRRVAA